MISRKLFAEADARLKKYPMIAVTGPRQSGKTTFCRQVRQIGRVLNWGNLGEVLV
jgi:predicted AAA+ superfamily ATPase